MLLVLDDAWLPQDLELFLTAGPRCVRLVTSRQRDVVPGREIRVGSMERDEAATLLHPEAGGDVGPLLDRTSCWPLAVTLLRRPLDALHRRQGLTLGAAADELAGELDRSGLGVIDELAAHGQERGVSSTLAISLDQLPATTRTRYVAIAAFPPGPRRLRAARPAVGRDPGAGPAGVRQPARPLAARRRGRRRRPPPRRRPRAPPRHPSDDLLWPQLAHHLLQADRRDELGQLLRDFRFLVARVWAGGPLALESDLRSHLAADDAHAEALLRLIQREAHLLLHHAKPGDLALTLNSRLYGAVDTELTHIDDALPSPALVPLTPFPDRSSPDLVRVLTGHDGEMCTLAWDPYGDLLAISHDHPTLRRWDIATGQQTAVVKLRCARFRHARLSPDGRHLAVTSSRLTAIVDPMTGVVLAGKRWESAALAWSPDSRCLAIT